MSEAEKKWKAFDNQFGWLAQDSSFKSREAYKAALRREIEKNTEPGHFRKILLDLLETVEP